MKIEITAEIEEEWMYYALLYGKDTADRIMAEKREAAMTENKKMVPVLYCDIDGTIRWGKDELGRFVNTADDVRVFDEVPKLLWEYKKLGWRIIGVSNQGGIAMGYQTMQQCVKAMAETQKQSGFAFDKIVWCSHHPEAETPEMAVCWCRKPRAGLVIEGALLVAEKTGELYPPHMGLMVGDRPEDVECAKNAGLPFLDAEEWRTGIHLSLLKKEDETKASNILYEKLTAPDVDNPGIKAIAAKHMTNIERAYSPTPEHSRLARTISQVDSPDEPLPEDVMNWALGVTNVKTKTIRAVALIKDQDFVFEGHLYTVVDQDEGMVRGARKDKDIADVMFWHPDLIGEENTHVLSWETTEVLVEDEDNE